MILGTGIDIVSVAEFDRLVQDETTDFIRGHFTDQEKDYCERASGGPALHLAGHYAAKEALIKALEGVYLFRPAGLPSLSYREIEICHDPHGRPYFLFSGRVADLVGRLKAVSHLSLSHDGDYAVAQVILS